MTTTHERINNDIKKNAGKAMQVSMVVLKSEIDNMIRNHTQLLMYSLKDLITPGTPAFDKESAYAITQIRKQIKTGLVEYLKKDIKK